MPATTSAPPSSNVSMSSGSAGRPPGAASARRAGSRSRLGAECTQDSTSRSKSDTGESLASRPISGGTRRRCRPAPRMGAGRTSPTSERMSVSRSTHRRVRRGAAPWLAAIALAASLVPSSVAASGPAEVARPGLPPATPELIDRDVHRGAITPAQGALLLTWALTAPARLPEAYVSDTPWSGTLPLLRLRERLPALGDAPAALAARAALRGTTFSCPGTSGSLPNVRSTKHFYLQYQGVGPARRSRSASTRARSRRRGPPRSDRSSGPSHRAIRSALRPADGIRCASRTSARACTATSPAPHFAGNNPSTSWNDRDAVASCMVLNRDFGPFPGTPLDALRATAAHEFNHSIQFGYGALTGFGKVTDVMVEGLATWMEDEVFDSSDDSYNYLWPEFTLPMGRYRAVAVPLLGGVPCHDRALRRRTSQRCARPCSRSSGSRSARVRRRTSPRSPRDSRPRAASSPTAYHNASIALRFLVELLGDRPAVLPRGGSGIRGRGRRRTATTRTSTRRPTRCRGRSRTTSRSTGSVCRSAGAST